MYTKVISDQEYQKVKAKYDTYHAARKTICKSQTCVTPEEQKLLPASPTNKEISSLEVYEFVHNPPQKYFAYVHESDKVINLSGILHPYKIPTHITTWTGEVIGEIIDHSHRYKGNFGDERINIRVKAINGKEYYGTYFKSSGDYCRLTMRKGQ